MKGKEGRPILGVREDAHRIFNGFAPCWAARPRGARRSQAAFEGHCASCGVANRKACRSARQAEISSEGLRRLASEGIGVTTAKADSSLGQMSEEAPDPLSIEPVVLLHKLWSDPRFSARGYARF
jgi:hypothetical protein